MMVPWAMQDPCLPPKAPRAISYMATSILKTQKPSFYPKKHLQGASASPRHVQIALLRSPASQETKGGAPHPRNSSPLAVGHRDRLPKEANGWPQCWKSSRLDGALSTESHEMLGLEGTSICSQLNQHQDVHVQVAWSISKVGDAPGTASSCERCDL